MNQANPLTPMQRGMAALEAFFLFECREFDREWHTRELANADTRLADYWEWVVHQIEADGQSVDDVIRTAMNTIYVNVTQTSETLDDGEDEGAAGLYAVAFGKHVADMTRAQRAGVALDIFHAHQGIGTLDDFEIVVVDGAGHYIDQDEAYEDGTHGDYGTVEKIAEPFATRAWSPTLYIEAYTSSAFAIPGWVRVTLTPTLIERLRALQEVCQWKNIGVLQTFELPDAWSNASQWRPDLQALNVTRDDFWYTAQPKNHESVVKTTPVPLDKLFELLETAKDHEVDPAFGWRLGSLYYHASDAEALIEIVEQQAENSGE